MDEERKDIRREKELDDDFIDDTESLEGFVVNVDDSTDSNQDEFRVKKRDSSRESSVSLKGEGKFVVVVIISLSLSLAPNTSPTTSVLSNWYEDLLPEDCATKLELSGKLMFLVELLKETTKLREKVLVFSQSLLTLDLIEDMIQQPQYGDYIEGINYFRLDGSTKVVHRTDLMKKFNKANSEE